ncbi:hypothetical protein J2S19_004221 [Metabacillus malikii]|uniref:Transposase n=1 Tax=Metabacillus malikii TaxID=1504265 RepID=A0ABT9ZKS3_9BACI|nr:hypothetical protein [Metabacillus malikii]
MPKYSGKSSTLFQIFSWINVKTSIWNNVLDYIIMILDHLVKVFGVRKGIKLF